MTDFVLIRFGSVDRIYTYMYVCSHVCIKILGHKIINDCLALDLSVIASFRKATG
jgi:hypothetical protein